MTLRVVRQSGRSTVFDGEAANAVAVPCVGHVLAPLPVVFTSIARLDVPSLTVTVPAATPGEGLLRWIVRAVPFTTAAMLVLLDETVYAPVPPPSVTDWPAVQVLSVTLVALAVIGDAAAGHDPAPGPDTVTVTSVVDDPSETVMVPPVLLVEGLARRIVIRFPLRLA